MADARQIGWREVLIVAAVAVGLVLGLDVITTAVPGLMGIVGGTPLVVGILLVGTTWLLWRIASSRPPEV